MCKLLIEKCLTNWNAGLCLEVIIVIEGKH